MSRAKKIKYIGIHCSAGFGNVESIIKYWREELKWVSPGYHIIVDLYGQLHFLLDFEKVSNGVKGFNEELINICYIGGVKKDKTGKLVGSDTRNEGQKIGLDNAIVKAVEWFDENGGDRKNLTILGHRDFSKDSNKNNIIDSWERIKECPSFDAIPEYAELQKAINGKTKIILPNR